MTGHDGIRPLININHYFFYKNLLIGIFYVYFKFQTYLKKKKKISLQCIEDTHAGVSLACLTRLHRGIWSVHAS